MIAKTKRAGRRDKPGKGPLSAEGNEPKGSNGDGILSG